MRCTCVSTQMCCAALERQDHHQVRGLPADARQRHQLLERRRHPAAEALDERLRTSPSRTAPCCGRSSPDRSASRSACTVSVAIVRGVRAAREQPRRGRERRRVLRARREQRGDQNLERILLLALARSSRSPAAPCRRSRAPASASRARRRAASAARERAWHARPSHVRTGVSGGWPSSTASDVRDREVGHRRARFGGGAGEVRDQQHVLERRAGRDALPAPSRRRRAPRRRSAARCSAHASAASSTTGPRDVLIRYAERFILRERLLIDQVRRLRRQRAVQRHDVGGRQQPIERHRRRRRAASIGDLVGVGDASCRTPAPSRRPRGRCGPRRRARAACRAAPCRACSRAPSPPTRRARSSRSPSPSRRVTREDERPGEVGAGVGEHVGRVGHDDAARAAGRRRRCCCSRRRRWRRSSAAVRPASSTAASMRSVSRQMSACLPATRRSSSSRGIAAAPACRSTSHAASRRASTDDGQATGDEDLDGFMRREVPQCP